jgi:ectoine hydroxylase-related dioxygenase (phytanoyl-CoA dioxygenase family)
VDVVDRENGAMGYVPGSHRWGKTFKPSDFATTSGTFPEVGGISLEGLDTLPEDLLDNVEIRYFDAEPGDVIVHHWATLHGSRGNVSASRTRRAASIRYALDGCCFYKRPSSPEPFRNTVEIADGAPLESASRFPVVWPSTGNL